MVPPGGPAPLSSFRLDDWLVEPERGQVSRDGSAVHLRPRVMEVLCCLAAARGAVVSRQRVIDTVWRTSYVSDNVVSQAVTELRGALGDDPKSPRYVECIPRRGYRLVARVADCAPAASLGAAVPAFVSAAGEHVIGPGETLVGRGHDAGLRIDLSEVSRAHARVVLDDAAVTVEDLGSKNGTFVNGRRITRLTRLADGDEVRFGTPIARFRFRSGSGTTDTAELALALSDTRDR